MATKTGAEPIAQTIAEACIGARIRILNRATTRIYDEQLRPLGIKFSQMNILTVVTLRGPIQPVGVARILSLEKSTLSRNVAIMEANGWIESRAGDTGNTRLLRTTPKGRRLLKKAAPAWRRAQEHITSLLGERTTTALLKSVNRFRNPESRT